MRIKNDVIKLKECELLLRNPREEDAELLLRFLKTTCGETRFLMKEPEEITLSLEEEKAFIVKQNESEQNLLILGFVDGEHVGNCSLMGMGMDRYRHRVSMAIALYQKYTGLGIGTAMIEKLFVIAREKGIILDDEEIGGINRGVVGCGIPGSLLC